MLSYQCSGRAGYPTVHCGTDHRIPVMQTMTHLSELEEYGQTGKCMNRTI